MMCELLMASILVWSKPYEVEAAFCRNPNVVVLNIEHLTSHPTAVELQYIYDSDNVVPVGTPVHLYTGTQADHIPDGYVGTPVHRAGY